jgi:hypothetical protein
MQKKKRKGRKNNQNQEGSLGEIGRHDRLKICSCFFWGIGSSPIVSMVVVYSRPGNIEVPLQFSGSNVITGLRGKVAERLKATDCKSVVLFST